VNGPIAAQRTAERRRLGTSLAMLRLAMCDPIATPTVVSRTVEPPFHPTGEGGFGLRTAVSRIMLCGPAFAPRIPVRAAAGNGPAVAPLPTGRSIRWARCRHYLDFTPWRANQRRATASIGV
jgi:hypothetical protein